MQNTNKTAHSLDEEVVVVGAGPVGLWVAAELRLAGVPVTVIDAAGARSPLSKALGMHARTVEVLAMRGMDREFLAAGSKVPAWHFGMLETKIDLRSLNTPFPYMLAHPQTQTEEAFERRVKALATQVHRGHRLTGLQQDRDRVTMEINGPNGPYARRASFVIGCDGAGSTVRKEAGIGFTGSDADVFAILGEVKLDDPPTHPAMHYFNAYGALILVPVSDGFYRITGIDAVNQLPGDSVSLSELRDWAVRVGGNDFGMRDPRWLSRFGNSTRQADQYRKGRVLLAGDAAHMHFPAGGVGLNVGLQDAMNLGWKLAAVVQDRGPEDLLDSYHDERHPVGEALMEHTLAQTALMIGRTAADLALRSFLSQLIVTQPQLSDELAQLLSGLDVRYEPSVGSHQLAGSRAVPAVVKSSETGLFHALGEGRPLFLELTSKPFLKARRLADRLGFRTASASCLDTSNEEWADAAAAVVRPDGHIWWVTTSEEGEQGALDAMASMRTSWPRTAA